MNQDEVTTVGMCVWLRRTHCCLYLNIEDLNIFTVHENMFTITELTLNKILGYIYVTEILTPKTLVYSKYISNCFLKENKIDGTE